jgi:dissimilatory sulfite reductase (desulfoviridin) alpha/beta subunit
LVIKVDNKKNSNEKKERTARFIERIGIDKFKNNVLEVIV